MSNELIEALKQILGWRELRSGNEFPIERIEEIARDAIENAALQQSLPQETPVPIAWARPRDINATMIATRGERAEIAPDMEPGFTVPLYLHPSGAQPSLPQDVEKWIAENEFKDSWGVNAVYTKGLSAFLAGKVLVDADIKEDAERYRLLRNKVAIIGTKTGAEFSFVNLPLPVHIAPDPGIELDSALDRTFDAINKDALPKCPHCGNPSIRLQRYLGCDDCAQKSMLTASKGEL